MRPACARYPVDRYLVQRSSQNELANIINDDIWNSEPSLRPEDEIMLRKLHEMLQTTADDLKLLSNQISKRHEPVTQQKFTPTPLDEEFNTKVHIEELVNAKFDGHKIIEKNVLNNYSKRDIRDGCIENKSGNNTKIRHLVTTGVQVSQNLSKMQKLSEHKNKKTLVITPTKTMNIDNKKENISSFKQCTSTSKPSNSSVSFKEICYKEPQTNGQFCKNLQFQDMPSINIRSELKTQKVLQLDIFPEKEYKHENLLEKNNVAVLAMQHEVIHDTTKTVARNKITSLPQPDGKPSNRKVLKISTGESSESTNNVSFYSKSKPNLKQQKMNTINLPLPYQNQSQKNKKYTKTARETKRSQKYLEEWRKRLNSVYGAPSTSRPVKTEKNIKSRSQNNLSARQNNHESGLNNANYIPYSKLTLGGVRVSDVEDEISNISNKSEIVLSPILDKILSSRENSFHKDSPRKNKTQTMKMLTTSDENLLQEVLDIQNKVKNTLSENMNSQQPAPDCTNREDESYDDDFDDEKTDISGKQSSKSSIQNSIIQSHSELQNNSSKDNDVRNRHLNQTFTKLSNLSIKNSVDVYEFVHSVDTQDNATQSNQTSKISLKETQTSPRNDKHTIQPIHNDLWPSIDPKGEMEKMFKLEKDFIKKLIIDEYGDIIEKTLNKPCTSSSCNLENIERNTTASQKNTQTSPAHVKTVMTSPTKTKTRTTSPFVLSTVNQQLSPIIMLPSDIESNVDVDKNDLGISINLSSPRFSLRLPQTSREVLSNIDVQSIKIKTQKQRPTVFSSSSSIEADYSSDISSIGEINRRVKKLQRKPLIPSTSEFSSSSSKSSLEPTAKIVALRSEGEISLGQFNKRTPRNKRTYLKSDGEMSLSQLLE